MIRIKRLLQGESDPYLVAGNITTGSTVLDCTLGLGADAIVASSTVGECGRVVALEDNRFLAFLVAHGLSTWEDGENSIIQAMRRVEVKCMHHFEALSKWLIIALMWYILIQCLKKAFLNRMVFEHLHILR